MDLKIHVVNRWEFGPISLHISLQIDFTCMCWKAEYHVECNSVFTLNLEFLIDSKPDIETLTGDSFRFQFQCSPLIHKIEECLSRENTSSIISFSSNSWVREESDHDLQRVLVKIQHSIPLDCRVERRVNNLPADIPEVVVISLKVIQGYGVQLVAVEGDVLVVNDDGLAGHRSRDVNVTAILYWEGKYIW